MDVRERSRWISSGGSFISSSDAGGMKSTRDDSSGARGLWRWKSSRGGFHALKMAARMRLMLGIFLVAIFGALFLVHRRSSASSVTKQEAGFPGMLEGEVFQCDRSQFRTDVCNMQGDIHMNSSNRSFMLYAVDGRTPLREEKIKPYTRKWEKSCMEGVHEVILQSVPSSSLASAAVCDVQHTVPGVVFSTGGYTGNLYHEFHDGLIPLFITTQHLNREVVLVISEFHEWWLSKYGDIIQGMSNYPPVNFEEDPHVHCFQEVTVGLHIHAELGIDPLRMPDHKSIVDFRNFLSRAYTLSPEELGQQSLQVPEVSAVAAVSDGSKVSDTEEKKQLTILVRNGTRVLLNLDEIVDLAEQLGFNVTLLSPDPTTELRTIFWILDKSDVLLGVHGAALTHFLFMRPGSVFIQIIPLGTDWAAYTYYGEPATKLGLQYLPYKIEPAESSLSDKYNSTDPILTNPSTIVDKGWWTMKAVYLEGQDVRPSIVHMRQLFDNAKQLLEKRTRLL
jgi:hypothetical protein